MKKILLLLTLTLIMAACSSDESPTGSSYTELEVADTSAISAKRAVGSIAVTGEIDRYRMVLNDYNRDVQIKCTSDTMRPDVDLLVNVYEMNANGELTMVAGGHAPENGMFPADIKINLFVDRPKELYVFVRDLLDDDASDNSYYLSAAYQAPPDGNESVASATALGMGADGVRDAIGSVGDVDNFSFSVSEAGVYDVSVVFEPFEGTGVRLSASLYDQDEMGTAIETRNLGTSLESHMLHYLPAGDYVVAIKDQGMDDFDNGSIFTISVDPVALTLDNNDTVADVASDADVSAPVTEDGSIDYSEDQDWYKVGQPTAAGDVHVFDLSFESDASFQYQLNLYEIDAPSSFNFNSATPVFSHNYQGNHDGDYRAMVKLSATQTYYLLVHPVNTADVSASAAYTLSMSLTSIDDDDEQGDGNNSDDIATPLTTENTEYDDKKISYRGDVDWYTITIPAGVDQILSVYLNIPDSPQVEYAMDINQRSEDDYTLIKRVANGSEERKSVDLKTSFIVQGGETYLVKVYDFQTDDSEDKTYSIRWDAQAIPGAPAAYPSGTTVYNDEKDEQANTSGNYNKPVTVEYPTGDTGSFMANTSFLTTSGTVSGDPKTIVSDWISGYIDYQGDEDWFALDLSEQLPGESDTSWYYTINVEMVATNSSVEYTWEYLPDATDSSTTDGSVNTRWCRDPIRWCNGIQASDFDDTTETDAFVSAMTGDNYVWIGSGDSWSDWRGVVLFRISDFNFLNTATDTPYLSPDDDWGYDAPYYFRVTLTYYSGASHP